MDNRRSKSNFPGPAADRQLSGTEWTKEAVGSVMALAARGKPADENELEHRIHDFFQFCATSRIRPGAESLSLALGVSRQTFWCWCRGEGVSERWQQICLVAKQGILAFLEQAGLTGHLSPPSFIFLLKNIGGYKDSVSFEDVNHTGSQRRTPEEIARAYGVNLPEPE